MYSKGIKRAIDILISLIILPFLGFLIIPVGFLIKKEDGGKIFYRDKRYGKDMTQFSMLKFRTMKENSPDLRNEDGTTFNSEKDPRLTKIGSYLRKSSLDEVPQFINILKGDMSLIGPRPSPMGNEKTYNSLIKQKFKVKPGITGLNQATLRNKATLNERYAQDVYYANHVSLALDIYIVGKTIVSVLKKKNIYNH